jgi:electron transport complex protein RnfE
MLLGDAMGFLELTLIPDYRGFLLMILPPGGFIALGVLLAGKRLLDRGVAARREAARNRMSSPEGEGAVA